jgi:hypothetical protein
MSRACRYQITAIHFLSRYELNSIFTDSQQSKLGRRETERRLTQSGVSLPLSLKDSKGLSFLDHETDCYLSIPTDLMHGRWCRNPRNEISMYE